MFISVNLINKLREKLVRWLMKLYNFFIFIKIDYKLILFIKFIGFKRIIGYIERC